jgi:hypothetical protein
MWRYVRISNCPCLRRRVRTERIKNVNNLAAKSSRATSPMTLKQIITKHNAGTWLVISKDGKVIGTASSADKARRRASSQRAPFLVLIASSSAPSLDGNGNGAHAPKFKRTQLNLPSFYRGVYKRVAEELGVDPSYVSRVARGERTSPVINRALENELKQSLASAQARHAVA